MLQANKVGDGQSEASVTVTSLSEKKKRKAIGIRVKSMRESGFRNTRRKERGKRIKISLEENI